MGVTPGKAPQRLNRPRQGDLPQVRVKRCGKSAPRARQRGRHGKPHREQDRIGTTRSRKASGPLRIVVRVGCLRRSVTIVPEEWPSRRVAQAARLYRTRLTGRLAQTSSGRKKPGVRKMARALGRRQPRDERTRLLRLCGSGAQRNAIGGFQLHLGGNPPANFDALDVDNLG